MYIKLSIIYTLNMSTYFREALRSCEKELFAPFLPYPLGYNFDRVFVQSSQGRKAAEGMPLLVVISLRCEQVIGSCDSDPDFPLEHRGHLGLACLVLCT